MNKEKILFRTKILLSLILACMIVFMYLLIGRTSAIRGLNLETDQLRKVTMKEVYRKETKEGTIYDSTGEVLSEAKEIGKTGQLIYPKEYSWLLGYTMNKYACGIKGRFENYLYMHDRKKSGADLTLTLNHKIQQKAYDLIKGTQGSMVIIDVHSGKVIALASSQEEEYNANEITNQEKMKKWNQIDGFFLANGYQDCQEPGSVFKVVTSAAILEKGLEKEKVNDKGKFKIGNKIVTNAGGVNRGTIGLQESLGYSSNVYFAKKAIELGITLNDKGEDFLLGKKIELDFTTLTSNYDLKPYSDEIIADTGYGQGKILVSPLQIAMIYQSIANDGVMLRPYLIQSIDFHNKNLYKGKKEELAKPISKETAQTLQSMLHKVATDYYKIDDATICTKTGTAQISGNKVKCYFASFDKDYVVVASKICDDGFGIDLKNEVLLMYEYLRNSE